MTRRIFGAFALLAGLIAALPAQAETKLLFNIFFPPGHFVQEVMHNWAADVEKVTGGNVKIDFAAGNLAPPPQQLSATASGIFDVSITANVFIKNKAPLVAVSQLPWLVTDAESASVALWQLYSKRLASKQQYPDVQLLSLFHTGPARIYSLTDTPINSVSELKRRRMWALPGEAAEVLKALDISPITSPAVQISESVSRGVVDGYTGLTPEAAVDFKASPYTKSITVFPTGLTSTSFSVVINKAKWASLSDKDRAAILSVSGETLAAKAGAAADKASAAGLAKMKADGIKVVSADPALFNALQAAAEPSYKKYDEVARKAGLDGRALLMEFKALQAAAAKR